MSDATHTIKAAVERRDNAAKEAGATTPKERQAMVSDHLDKKAAREGRWFGG
ncbi:hypothetical protein ACFY5K_25555 [Streptomyces griseofuscus]|uniref:hypothetical protein n=1 Tax=Streptomyces griseofuscus TaxID=146922 RepID=UPI0036A17590